MNNATDADIIRQSLHTARLVPVVTLDDPAHAEPLADALVAGGICVIEVTMRTPAGPAVLDAIGHRTDILAGAGTVLTADQVTQVADSGAEFIISPGLDSAVVQRSSELGIFALPGIATPSEAQRAIALGLSAVKLFPAHVVGGLDMIDALAGPFPGLQFMPSGGVGLANAAAYLAHPAVLAVSGSWMVPRSAVIAGDWARITALAAEAVRAVDHAVGA